MDDIGGLGKLADSKLANKVYDDAGSATAKELGKLGADFTKTLRLFTAPFQLAALAQDRFEVWLNEARSRVPLERQVEAPAYIAGPALRAMLFMEEDNPLASFFVNLLSQAIDKESAGDVHPSFVHILEQISPDEALLLYKLRSKGIAGINRLWRLDEKFTQIESLTSFEQDDFVSPKHISMYFEHLEALNLVEHRKEDKVVIPKDKPDWWEGLRWYGLTEFGAEFLKVCIQESPIFKNADAK